MQIDKGKLRERITLQKFEKVKDKNDITKEKWITWKTVYASVNNLYGKEFELAKATNTENTVEFVIRYSKQFESINSEKIKITWQNKTYNITFIDNMAYGDKLLKLKGTVTTK